MRGSWSSFMVQKLYLMIYLQIACFSHTEITFWHFFGFLWVVLCEAWCDAVKQLNCQNYNYRSFILSVVNLNLSFFNHFQDAAFLYGLGIVYFNFSAYLWYVYWQFFSYVLSDEHPWKLFSSFLHIYRETWEL